MPDWDRDRPELRATLLRVLTRIAEAALARQLPSISSARQWQRELLEGLSVPDARWMGAFRGEPGLENMQARVLSLFGTPAERVAEQLERFEAKLRELVTELDASIPPGKLPDLDQLAAVIDLCAWTHAEWIRIHPFANGNGRTARLWANSILLRYALPPFVRLRPRPDLGYGAAGAKAMEGDWKPTAICFRRLLNAFLESMAAS